MNSIVKAHRVSARRSLLFCSRSSVAFSSSVQWNQKHGNDDGYGGYQIDFKDSGQFWSKIIGVPDFNQLPNFVKGCDRRERGSNYPKLKGCDVGNSIDLQALQKIGEQGEFKSKSTIYTRHKTYAIQIGYVGAEYEYGYARQKLPNGKPEPKTVELDIRNAMIATKSVDSQRRSITIAGRTDKYVNAISQIFTFVHSDDISPMDLLQKLRQTEPALTGRIVFHDCARVPRQFNARASALWRRYLYLVPLKFTKNDQDACENTHEHEPAAAGTGAVPEPEQKPIPPVIDIKFVDAVLRRIEGLELPYNSFATGDDRKTGKGLLDLCTMHRARAFEVCPEGGDGTKFLCVELVGSRFLRRMVRLIVATAVREAIKPIGGGGEEGAEADDNKQSKGREIGRNVNIIYDICLSNDRFKRASPFPGSGLCFAGVGYDTQQFSFYKQQKKVDAEYLRKKYAQDSKAGGV